MTARLNARLAALLLVAASATTTGAQIAAPPAPKSIDLTQPRTPNTARGVVFHDANRNAMQDQDERGLPGVLVSNGADIVRTDSRGRYEIPINEAGGPANSVVFVCKPRGFRHPTDEHSVPRFAYVHKPDGSPRDLEYPGVRPTGPLPSQINFALFEHEEPDRFQIAVIGDPQPRNVQEIDWMAEKVISEMIDLDVEGVIALGDIMFDDLSLYPAYNQAMSAVGAPVYNVHGNHDLNFDAPNDELSDETWERVYGATNYAFQIADTHFVVLDNVVYEGGQNDRRYHGRFIEPAMAFLANYLELAPKDDLVVVCFHIPLWDVRNRAEFLELLGSRPRTLSLSAHWHVQRHVFYGQEDGWPADHADPFGFGAHHHLCHATACGSWWRGMPGPDGIPHATMRDGTPPGHSVITFEDGGYTIDYKAADHGERQMAIHAPDQLTWTAIAQGEGEIVVNIWAGTPKDTVEMRLMRTAPFGRQGVFGWRPLEYTPRFDPDYEAAFEREESLRALHGEDERPNWRAMRPPREAYHIWTGALPAGVDAGAYRLEIRWTDLFGRTHVEQRPFRVDTD
ncbi:MAG: calcineurin-like phosphoesterase C-terminal domain-containing protein [Planctomycetota bacterium]